MEGKLQLSSPLSDCVIGEEKEITLKVVPTANDSSGFMGNVEEVVDYHEADADSEDQPTGKYAPPSGKDMKGHQPAIAIVISSAKPKAK